MPAGLPLLNLRAALLHALGLSLVPGCTGRTLDDAAGAEGGTPPATATGTLDPTTGLTPTTTGGMTGGMTSGTGTASTGSTGVASTGAGSTGVTSTGDGTTTGASSGAIDPSTSAATTVETSLDTTVEPDMACTALRDLGQDLMASEVNAFPGCEAYSATDCFDYIKICAPLPDGLASCDACAPDCLGTLPAVCGGFFFRELACGPFASDGLCCHVVEYGWNCTDGRPFLVEGTAVTAPARSRRDWTDGVAPSLAGLDADARAELAALWTADALAEHASIASFARFTLQLLALGAPPDLIARACAAQADEVAHARVAFALASAYAGAPVGPGPLDIAGALAGPLDRESILVAVLLEGCVGETIAAAELDLAAGTCEDAAVAAALRRLSADEQRHATLAWRTLQWGLARGDGSLRAALAGALARVASPTPSADRLPPALLRRHGRLPASERAALAAQCLAEVIVPCARALLAATGAASESLRA